MGVARTHGADPWATPATLSTSPGPRPITLADLGVNMTF